jgi:hypothetical protein
MSDQNPYKAPVSTEEAAPSGPVTLKTRELLGQASPWLRFLLVLGYIVLGLMALGAVVAIIVVVVGLRNGGVGGSTLAATALTFSIFALVFAVVYYFPLRILGRLAKGARRYKTDGEAPGLELVASGVRGLAKFYGIFAIVALSGYAAVGIYMLAFARLF